MERVIGLCECGKNDAVEDHPCPYAEEIHDDDTPCNCCEDCEGECWQDI
jgi:hypothetical protein